MTGSLTFRRIKALYDLVDDEWKPWTPLIGALAR
jgi:hypothetical protein